MDRPPPADNDQQLASFFCGNSNSGEIETLQSWQKQSSENKKTFDKSAEVWDNCKKPISISEFMHDKLQVMGRIMAHTSSLQRRDRVFMHFLRLAAIFIGPIMLAIGWYIGSTNLPSQALTWNTVTTPRKHIAMCTLADGTEVWLNAGSTLSYPSNAQPNQRVVKLTGEGYFKVAKDAAKPFLVITQKETVKVLGTSFNMKAYPGEERIVTTLEEGSLEIFTPNQGSASRKLRPGEQSIYDINTGKIEIDTVDPILYSSWRGEKFLFKDADLITIIAELERLYDIKIYIKNPKLEKLRFRGMFSYDQDLLDAFETLRHSVKLNYTIKDREVWLQ
jgi:transmembrane sensor